MFIRTLSIKEEVICSNSGVALSCRVLASPLTQFCVREGAGDAGSCSASSTQPCAEPAALASVNLPTAHPTPNSAPPQTWAGPGGGALPHTTMSADSWEFPRCHTQTGKDRTHWGKGLEWTDLALAGRRPCEGAALSSPMVLGLSQRRIHSTDSTRRQTAGRPSESRAQQE